MKNIIAASLLLSVAGTGLWAQSVAGLGAVTGTVRDASGSAVPDATVTLTNEAKGIRRVMQTTGAGLFNAPALVPATGYSLTISKQGFANWEVKEFQVQVGNTVDFSVAMQVSSAATTVDVTDTAPIVDDTKSGVSDVITQEQIDGLPINGRRADTFALMTPAVVADGTFGLITFRGISASNAFLTDGNYTSNSYYMENAGRTRISTQISQDAVQEFQVLADGFSAEFGRAMGGIINTVTRSGTNNYHGTGYEFFRNRTIDATDRYAPPNINPPEWRHQAGGSFGGPIRKDKLFFFLNTELVKRNFPGVNRVTNTQITDATGNIVAPSNCGAPATPAQCAAAASFIQAQMNVLVPRTVSSIMGFGKIDYHLNDRNTFSIDFNAMHWRSPNGIQTQGVLANGNMLGNNGNSTVETRYGNAQWTAIVTPNSLNQLHYGFFKDRLSDPAASQLWPSTGGLYILLPGSTTVGAAQAYPRTLPSELRNQIVDNYSWTVGAHAVKFGVDFATTEDFLNQLFNGNGGYTYNSLSAFAADFSGNTTGAKNYSTFTQQFGNRTRDFRTTDISAYVQDTWKIGPRITLNYGLRYEKYFLPQPVVIDPNYPQTGKISSPNKDFAPRISAAYAVNDKTVIRAGFGLFYAPFPGNGIDTLYLGNGRTQTSISVNPTQPGAPVFPNTVASASSVPAGTSQLNLAAPGFRNPYTEQATFAVERQIGRDMSFTASYIYNHGVGLWVSHDINLTPPSVFNTYTIDDISGNAVGTFTTPIWTAANKIDSRYSHIYQVENAANSTYNGLALQFRKRMSYGLSAQVSYTWSHAIDDGQQSGGSTIISWTQSNTYNGNYALDRGSSGTDQRHRAVINFLWTPKFTSGNSVAERYLVNGWELSTITTMASSQPNSGLISVSGTQFTNTPLLYTSSINGSGGWSRVPFWPVNSVDIDRVFRVDARLTRNIPINERVKVLLMFEGANIFNTEYNTSINTSAFAATGGVLRPVTTRNTLGQTVTSLGFGTASQAFPDGTNARRLQAGIRIVF